MKGLKQASVDLRDIKRRLTRLYTMQRISYEVLIDLGKDTNELIKKVESYIDQGAEVEYEEESSTETPETSIAESIERSKPRYTHPSI